MSFRNFGRRFSAFEQVLFIIIFLIIILIISGTIIAFALNKANPGVGMRKQDPTPEKIIQLEESMDVYTGVGELRALTADDPPRTLVISPYFSYKKKDNALYEELVQKNKKIRALILDYIISYTQEELLFFGELKVKANLFQIVNDELVLGKVDEIYFTEYIFF